MAASLKYVIDTNVLVEASRRYYPFDFAKPFWSSLSNFASAGVICSIDKVGNEIKNGNDQLKNWAGTDFANYFLSTKDSNVLSSYAQLVRWAQSEAQYTQRAKDIFMNDINADAWVIAFAHAHQIKVVTHEAFAADAQKIIPIPNACIAFNIGYCDTFEMLRDLKFTF